MSAMAKAPCARNPTLFFFIQFIIMITIDEDNNHDDDHDDVDDNDDLDDNDDDDIDDVDKGHGNKGLGFRSQNPFMKFMITERDQKHIMILFSLGGVGTALEGT